MAAVLCEYLLLKYFFPKLPTGAKSRKEISAIKQLFMLDMQFNLTNGKMPKKSTTVFLDPQAKVCKHTHTRLTY